MVPFLCLSHFYLKQRISIDVQQAADIPASLWGPWMLSGDQCDK